MSEYHPPETLAVCKHNLLLSLACALCEIDKRFEKLESDMFAELQTREVQISILSDKIKKLEDFLFAHRPYEKNLSNRIQDVEQFGIDYAQDYAGLETRIDRLEKTVSDLVDKIAEIANYCYAEKLTPQQLPSCKHGLINHCSICDKTEVI